ncbi:uncharacterized protein [Linepithema humile]|uniref:uncharacterized protein n=1 Tax=Linepithema humile TaxID=83485 RepID=UPI00351F459E
MAFKNLVTIIDKFIYNGEFCFSGLNVNPPLCVKKLTNRITNNRLQFWIWSEMKQVHLQSSWPAILAVRENLLPSDTPYIPILIEDILQYASQSDYEQNCIKNVLTIGEILPGAARIVQLQSVSPNCELKVTLSLEKLPVHAIYLKDEKKRHLPIWEKFRTFKVYGTLERRENKVILIAEKLLQVQDIRGSLNVLSLLSTAVRPMHYQ